MNWRLTDEQYDKLNPPPANFIVDEDTKKVYVEYLNNKKWLWMGYVPMPTTRIGWFLHHLIHGVWMKYPLWKVVLFAFDKSNDSGTIFILD